MGQALVFILPLQSAIATEVHTPCQPAACQGICVYEQQLKHFRSFLNRKLVQ